MFMGVLDHFPRLRTDNSRSFIIFHPKIMVFLEDSLVYTMTAPIVNTRRNNGKTPKSRYGNFILTLVWGVAECSRSVLRHKPRLWDP